MRLRLFLFIFLVHGTALIAQKTKYEYSSPELEKAVELYREKQYEASLSAYSEIISNAIGQNDFEKAVFAMEKKGNVLRLRGRNQEAIQLMDSAIVLAKQKLPKDHILLSKVFFRRGVIDHRTRTYFSARTYFDSAQNFHNRASSFDSTLLFSIIEYKLYAYIYSEGPYDTIHNNLNKVMNFGSKKLSPDKKLQFLQDSYTIYHQQGDDVRALNYAVQAYRYAQINLDEVSEENLYTSFFNVCKILFHQGHTKMGIDLINSFKVSPENIPFMSFFNNLLGALYTKDLEYETALYYFQKAHDLSLEASDTDDILLFSHIIEGNIAVCYSYLEKFDFAQRYFDKSINGLHERISYSNHEFQFAFYALGEYFSKQKDWKNSLIMSDSALRHGIIGYNTPIESFPSTESHEFSNEELSILKHKAQSLFFSAITNTLDTSLLMAAENYAEQTHRLIKQNKNKYLTQKGKIVSGEDFKGLYSAGTAASLELYRATKDEKYIDRALTHMSRGKAQLFLEQAGDLGALRNQNLPIELRQAFVSASQKADSLEDRVNKLLSLNIMTEELPEALDLQVKWADSLKNIKKSIASLAPVQEEDISVGDIRKRFRLSGKKAFVEFLDADSVMYAVAVSEKRTAFEKIKKDSLFNSALDSMLAMASSQQGPVPKKFAKTAAYLYQRLLAGLEEQLGGFEAITVVPDEKLALLPFGLLAKSSTGKEQSFKEVDFLLKRASVNHLFSSMANFQDEGQKEGKGILGFGYVGEGITDERATMGGLPGAMKEIEFLSSRFRGSYFMGNSGTKQKFLKEAGQYDIIHLAVHGKSDPSDRFRSSLVFNGEDDYNLTASDLYSTDLRSKLAVLSACETGIGKVSEGEGTFSIARGFAIAGVPAIVTTLWKVNDISGSKISRLFYGNLEKGMDKAEALRQAKIQYLSEADNLTESPFYWGNYILIGDPEPIVLEKRNGIKAYAIPLLIILVLISLIIGRRKQAHKPIKATEVLK